jgi:hypothetical protein
MPKDILQVGPIQRGRITTAIGVSSEAGSYGANKCIDIF